MWKAIAKVSSLTKYVVFSISIVILYSIVDIVLQCYGVTLSDTLTTCVYGFFGGEVVVCALIKIFKLKDDGKNIEEEDTPIE